MLRAVYFWVAYSFCWLISCLFFPVRAKGRENLPSHGSYIVASNHLSNLDPIILTMALRRRINYIAKESLFKIPILGILIRLGGGFPVNRNSADISAMKEALKRLKGPYGLIVFPEGTRLAMKKGKGIQHGIGFLAYKSKVPVVPAYIQGSEKILPPGARFPRFGRVTVTFGKPVLYSTKKPYEEIAAAIYMEIQKLAE